METRGSLAFLLQRTVKLRSGLPWLVAALVLFLAWPAKDQLIYSKDSVAYIEWPADYVVNDVRVLGARPPFYPAFLRLVGHERFAVVAQVLVSVASWCFLGWIAGRTPGLVIFGALSLTGTVWFWNTAIISESISLSLMATLIGTTIILARGWSWRRYLLWSAAACFFSWTRDPNIYFLPFLIVPLLRLGWQRVAPIAAVSMCIWLVVFVDSHLQDRWQYPLTSVFVKRIVPDPEDRAYFEGAGMPSSSALLGYSKRPFRTSLYRTLQKDEPEFLEWIESHGRTSYLGWLLLRPVSYIEAWTQLRGMIEREVPDVIPYLGGRIRTHPPQLSVSGWLDGIAFPLVLWWLLGTLPFVEWMLRREIGVLSLMTASLVGGTYVQAFIGYHAGVQDLLRHMTPAIVLYWTGFWVGLAALLEIVWKKISVTE